MESRRLILLTSILLIMLSAISLQRVTGQCGRNCAVCPGAPPCTTCANGFLLSSSTNLCERISFVFDFVPLRGSVEGGTLVKMKYNKTYLVDLARNFDPFSVLIYFSTATRPVNVTESLNLADDGPSEIVFRTPAGLSPGEANIKVVLGNIARNTTVDSGTFTYLSSLDYERIAPLRHFVSGGTSITINGNSLDNKREYSLLLKIFIYGQPYVQGILQSEETSNCSSNLTIPNEVVCLMPALNLPDRFLDDLSRKSSPRTKRESDKDNLEKFISSYIDVDGNDAVVELFLCYKSNFEDCKFIDATFIWIPNPKIGSSSEIIEVEIGVETYHRIKGSNLLSGASEQDYLISVGEAECRKSKNNNAKCSLNSITDDEINMVFPINEPMERNDDTCNPGMDMAISLGVRAHLLVRYSCVRYTTFDPSEQLKIIIGAAVGGGGLLIILLVIAVVCCVCCAKKRRERKERARQTNQDTGANKDRRKGQKGTYATRIV